jgi:hypothetical protein
MNQTWTVRIEDSAMEALLAQPMHPLVEAVLEEWITGLRARLQETDGYPPEAYPVYTEHPALIGITFEERLLALYPHRRTRYRTWLNLWLWPRERREILILWLAARDAS